MQNRLMVCQTYRAGDRETGVKKAEMLYLPRLRHQDQEPGVVGKCDNID